MPVPVVAGLVGLQLEMLQGASQVLVQKVEIRPVGRPSRRSGRKDPVQALAKCDGTVERVRRPRRRPPTRALYVPGLQKSPGYPPPQQVREGVKSLALSVWPVAERIGKIEAQGAPGKLERILVANIFHVSIITPFST